MTTLVTGGAGYIGSHMVLALLDAGRKVVVLDDLSTGHVSAVPSGVPLVKGDCGDEGLLGDIFQRHGVDAIIHFAGSIVVPDSVSDPLGYYRNNTIKSRSLIAAAVDHGIENFVFSSTAAVYGDVEVSPIPETAVLLPASPYGTSKWMTELMLRDAARAHPLRYAALRYFNVAGADPHGRSGQSSRRATHLIKIASQAALGMRPQMEIFGGDYATHDGTCVRDYIHVSDLAEAHRLALEHLEAGGDNLVLNCGDGRGFSVKEVIETVKRVSGVDFKVVQSPRRAGDPAELVASTQEIRRKLGWKPAFNDLEVIVRHALAWESKLQAATHAESSAA